MKPAIVATNRRLFAADWSFAQFTASRIKEIVGICSGWQDGFGIPQGYTYLGQFLAHEIASRERPGSPASQRSRRLDLDSVYGPGAEFDQLGHFIYAPETQLYTRDLLRDPETKLARIPDFRNDEHVIISQLHLTIQLFHNAVLRKIRTSPIGGTLGASLQFEFARKYVVATVQRIYAEDYLRKSCDPEIYSKYVERRLNVFEIPAYESDLPYEISHAALRFGHSQVRAKYFLNFEMKDPIKLRDLFMLGGVFGGPTFEGIPKDKRVDWRKFFPWKDDEEEGEYDLGRRINPKIVEPMSELIEPPSADIVLRNVEAGIRTALPPGQIVAKRLSEMNVDSRIEPVIRLQQGDALQEQRLRDFQLWNCTPLWLYILIEAPKYGSDGKHLGPLGSVFLCETIRSAIDCPDKYRAIQADCYEQFQLPCIATFVQLVKLADPETYSDGISSSKVSGGSAYKTT